MIQFEEGDDHIIEDESRLPFRLLRNLGHGHSGNVEEVQNTITGAAFARKTIAVRGKRAKLETERIFQNEVKIIRGLNKHHHIIRVFATYMAKREVGLILQPVASDGDLGRFLETIEDVRSANASDPRLEPLLQVVDRAFGCLAGGLTFMHQQRIRHKDIKPQNILVHQGSVIYTDFGYSLDSSHLSHSTTEGQPDSLTRRYSAPEVHEHGERNSSSDVFSLGCVYLELLAVKSNSPALLPDEATFSAEMDNIHHILCSSTPMTDTLSLCATITSMTLRDKKNRRKAADVMDIFIRSPKYCCDNCRVSERIGNDSAKSLLSIASPTSTQIPDVISQSVNSEDQAVAFSESTPTRPSSSLQIVRISTENPSDATTSGTTMPAPKWSDELGMLLKYEWSEKYQRMYRQQYVQTQGWVFLDWNVRGRKGPSQPPQSDETTPSQLAIGIRQARLTDKSCFFATPKNANQYELDPASYTHQIFFRRGRVFAMVSQENIDALICRGNDSTMRKRTHDLINRFIVVSQTKSCFLAVPIIHRHVIRENPTTSINQYAVAYSYNHYSPPDIRDTGLLEQAICIRHTDAEPPLKSSARVWFGEHYHMQYNLVARDIGFVHPDWLSTLVCYWKIVQGKEHDHTADVADIIDCQDESVEHKCSEHDADCTPDHLRRDQQHSISVANGQALDYKTAQSYNKSISTGPAARIDDVATPIPKAARTYSLTQKELFAILDETNDGFADFDWLLD